MMPESEATEITRDAEYYYSSADLIADPCRLRTGCLKSTGSSWKGDHPSSAIFFPYPKHPIHIPDVTVIEFRALLDLFYKPPGINPAFSPEEWLAILPIAHRFQVAINFEYVMERLETATPRLPDIEQVAMVVKYNLPMSYVRPALTRLVARKDPLTGEEIERIPPETTSLLSRARETNLVLLYRGLDRYSDPTDQKRVDFALKQVEVIFG